MTQVSGHPAETDDLLKILFVKSIKSTSKCRHQHWLSKMLLHEHTNILLVMVKLCAW